MLIWYFISSLNGSIDAGNLVSYPKSGTTAYNLTGSGTGTLTNGVGYNNIYGGTFNFDGVDDYANLGNIINSPTELSVNFWVKNPNGNVIITKGFLSNN